MLTRRLCNFSYSLPLFHYNCFYNTLNNENIRIGIIGAGPAGFYTANSLFKEFEELNNKYNKNLSLHIDIIDKTPIGDGLVRSGVAPDHPEVKHVENRFQSILTEYNNKELYSINFLGNINIGRYNKDNIQDNKYQIQISLPEIRNCYHAIVFACGAEGERRLNIPGNHLKGVFSAGTFVRFYNAGISLENNNNNDINILESINNKEYHKIAIVGHGNVALDAARIILKGSNNLNTTDITNRALYWLDNCNIKEVHLFGRRGIIQASFTNKELREMFEIDNCNVYIAKEDLYSLNEASINELSKSRTHKRMISLLTKKATIISKHEILSQLSNSNTLSDKNSCFIHFQAIPVEYKSQNNNNTLDNIIIETTTLEGNEFKQKAIPSGNKYHLSNCNIAFESLGYYPLPIQGLQFNNGKVIHNEGRILNTNNEHIESIYTSGWFKRGSNGIIATNVWDAQETSRSIIDDLLSEKIPLHNKQPFYNGIKDYIESINKQNNIISLKEWLLILEKEKKNGLKQIPPKPREKYTSSFEMISAVKE